MAVLGVNMGRPMVTNGDGGELFPNYFGEDVSVRAHLRNHTAELYQILVHVASGRGSALL